MTIAAAMLEHARRAPDRTAIGVEDRRVTYAALAAGVDACASGFLARARPGARIGLLLPSDVAFLEAFLGAGQAGMAALVLHPGWSQPELGVALRAGRPDLVVTTPELARHVGSVLVGMPTIEVDGERSLVESVSLTHDRRAQICAPPPGDDRPFYVGFTSGSTGGPKGFVRDHRSWLRSFDACREFGIAPDDEVAIPGDLAHSLFLFAALHALAEGAAIHLQRPFHARRLARLLAEVPISRLYAVPAMVTTLLAVIPDTASRSDPAPSGTLRTVISSGSRWPASLRTRVAAQFPDAEVIDFYGSSECSFVSHRRVGIDDPATDVGTPFPQVDVEVRDEDGRRLAPGIPGRLWVRSGMLFTGYLDVDATAAVRDARGFVTTGDVVRQHENGRLHLLGRADTMLNCGGTNVFPEHVERTLEEHPGVQEAVVIGQSHRVWGELPCAVLRLTDGATCSRASLRSHARDRLGAAARPRRFLVVDDFPRTPGGKPALAVLTRQVESGAVSDPLP